MSIRPQEIAQLLPTLKPSEKDLMVRFCAQPEGPLFLHVAQLLHKKGYYNEALVVVEDGLSRFPNLFSARVFLAKELFSRGELDQAHTTLKDSIASHPDNLMGQRLFLKIQISLGYYGAAQKTLHVLKNVTADDAFTAQIRHLAGQGAWQEARESVLQELHNRGIEPNIKEKTPLKEAVAPGASGTTKQPSERSQKTQFLWEGLAPELKESAPWDEVEMALKGVKEVSSQGFLLPLGANHLKNMTLEKKTLATLYLGQKEYLKACQVLSILVQENPKDQNLLSQYKMAKQMARKARAQEDYNLKTNEKKLNFLEKILHAIEEDRKPNENLKM